ncbi:MAG: DUF4271 domain-containing protein [Tannerellaceae bacterium]|jgi:hypothetical protein|nr:DUF4271 domain-containing protein [Tannerellaceae bacterium]
MQGFEGYAGIQLWEGQIINDLIFALLFCLLLMFSVVFHNNYRLFNKMVRDVIHAKDRQSLFEEVSGNESVFRSFMVFQSLFLSSLAIFRFSRHLNLTGSRSGAMANLGVIMSILLLLLIFYMFKRLMYATLGSIFIKPDRYRNWQVSYTASMALWGVLLYVPVLWVSFAGRGETMALILFAAMFAGWRTLMIYKTVRIFDVRSVGIMYILLYLCGQELLPFFFLYEGLKYMYNIIDQLALWH